MTITNSGVRTLTLALLSAYSNNHFVRKPATGTPQFSALESIAQGQCWRRPDLFHHDRNGLHIRGNNTENDAFGIEVYLSFPQPITSIVMNYSQGPHTLNCIWGAPPVNRNWIERFVDSLTSRPSFFKLEVNGDPLVSSHNRAFDRTYLTAPSANSSHQVSYPLEYPSRYAHLNLVGASCSGFDTTIDGLTFYSGNRVVSPVPNAPGFPERNYHFE